MAAFAQLRLQVFKTPHLHGWYESMQPVYVLFVREGRDQPMFVEVLELQFVGNSNYIPFASLGFYGVYPLSSIEQRPWQPGEGCLHQCKCPLNINQETSRLIQETSRLG